MKHAISLLLITVIHIGITGQERLYDYRFFENSNMSGPYFFSHVSYEEGSYIRNIRHKLPVSETHYFTPPNSLELNYSNGNGFWEAAVEFEKLRGQDYFKEATHLSFWLFKGDVDAGLLPLVQLCFQDKERRTGTLHAETRSAKVAIDNYLNGEDNEGWTWVKIPLSDFGPIKQLPNCIIFSNSHQEGEGQAYIDQLELITPVQSNKAASTPEMTAKAFERHVDIYWDATAVVGAKYVKVYRSDDNSGFKPVGIQVPWYGIYTDFTGESDKTYSYKITLLDENYNETDDSNTVSISTRSFSDEELLDMVQEAAFRYYWDGAEANSGLALENIPGRKDMIATGASGFGIMAIIVGAERGFISREQAVERLLKICHFLKACDTFHGAVSHFIDGPSGHVEPFFGERDNGGDLVETSFLFQGLLTARSYFDGKNARENEIREIIIQLWEAVEWDWYDQHKKSDFLTWHWSPDKGWLIDHQLIGWNETLITYLLAIASPTHPVPASMYYKGWASQSQKAAEYRKDWGQTDDGANYTNGNYYHGIQLPVGVSNGGPLFFIHYSFLGLNPHLVDDSYTNYFENNRNIALINWRYCSENPKNHRGFNPDFWGLTASDGPWGYRAIEPNVDNDNGTLAPTGALASFPYTPEQSMAALKNMYREHGRYLWGEYGFKDAVNLQENWCARIYMGLNQAPVAVMIENYRSGLLWNLFMQNDEITNALYEIQKLNNEHAIAE
ncbi:hypothetical protein KDU71_20760 [Carboxylicivirga sediminis]|uniref:Glycoamylase-like domain-containing protein n=1 Tax=Carboxylicivirga sediminis TaxID=2006564 RepID=A0A941F9Z0_9BACT|nr:glucoamylase family protein [Carboxylicivirga sediminis]MBR8538013.1 hypothetical protein [Carboxylicivirga sediminis]